MFYGATPIIFERAKILRLNLTESELLLWYKLKERFPGYKFRRQHPISRFITDFYCHKLKLIIELDGLIHSIKDVMQIDQVRQKELE